MKETPVSVAVISWILIVLGTLGLISSLMLSLMVHFNPQLEQAAYATMAKSPIPVPVQVAESYAQLTAITVAGLFMLIGKGWARMVYVVFSLIGFAIGLTSPLRYYMGPRVIIFLIFLYFLFRPRANAYFSQAPVAPPAV